ncbi:hypothetical protein N431DRAFT_133110 [Stipitochalara longipes BDJ]|nr:hypothetical protein N431DRAFT_133110 [Stipitochalara longipes BDJ]
MKMWGVRNAAVVAWTFASFTCAQTTSTINTVVATKVGSSSMITGTSTQLTQKPTSPCGIISSSVSAYSSANPGSTASPRLSASLALQCLNSVPLNTERSKAFLEYVYPYLQFQSNQAYLKDLPSGWTLNGVDLFGGLSQIAQNLDTGAYSNQWQFETDLYTLVNILPRDFHLNLPLPLLNIFYFGTDFSLASVSLDGTSLPEVYSAAELINYVENGYSTTAPSPIISINDEPTADYILRVGVETQQYLDPDAIYNLVFYSIPLSQQENGNAYKWGHLFGFASDSTTYSFSNGTTLTMPNLAILNKPFTGVVDGTTLFNLLEIPVSKTSGAGSDDGADSEDSSGADGTTPQTSSTTLSTVSGYPTPIVLHPSGYTGGYFLNDSKVAVLAMTAFADPTESEAGNVIQQTVIRQFLAACKAAGMSKLIVDLQGNGGGHIENGYDAFKQLFPTLEPFGATRFRYTPFAEYISMLSSTDGFYNYTDYIEYQVQAVLNADLEKFPSYVDFMGPEAVYSDNFTSLMRYNLSDPTIQLPFVISGYYNNTNISPQIFAAEDIVMLYDGACGSTCALFSQFMKSQAGVRSIGVGGRPQQGPMQGVAGSKGAEVYTYGNIAEILTSTDKLYKDSHGTFPPYTGPPEYNVSLAAPPLGPSLSDHGRFNLRNNYNSSSPSETPLQFVYEATNCRLWYQPSDLVAIENLWERVVDVTWGSGKCVSGSTVTDDDTMPSGSYDTVPFGPGAVSQVMLNSSLPGLVANKDAGTGQSSGLGSLIMQMIS